MRKILIVLFVGMLAACVPLAPVTATASPPVLVIYTSLPKEMLSPVPTWRVLFPPTPTPTSIRPTVMPTIVVSPTQTDPGCMRLIEPADGAALAKHERTNLKWENLPGVKTYIVLLEHPGGLQERLQAPKNELTLKLPVKLNADSYVWSVLAYDANNELICGSAAWTFTIFPGSTLPATETPTTSP